MIFVVLFSSLSFAETSNEDDGGLLGEWLQGLLKWAPNAIGDGLGNIGPSAEEIYLPDSPYYFSFSTSNIFGLFTSKAYPIFKLIAMIMISPLLSLYGAGLIKANSGIGRKTSLDAISALIMSVGVLWFLPEILNFIFEMKDGITSGLNQVFVTGNNKGFVDEMRQLSEDGGVIDALIYLASVVFSYWLMANYVGMSFGFATLLLYTPVGLVVSSAKNLRKTASELNKTLWGYVLTPAFDISLLGIVSLTRGIDPSAFGMDPLMFNLVTVILVMSVIPLRSGIKKLFGFGPMLGDMLGVGMIAAVAGMAMRGGSKGKYKSSGNTGDQGYENEDYSNQDRASYYSDLAAMDRQKQNPGTAVANYDPALANLPPLKEMTREDFLAKHQGKSYFSDRDIGGLSNQEKADYYENLSSLDEVQMRQDRQDRIKSGALSGLKKGMVGYGAVVGASTGLFMGPAGAVAGGVIGAKLTDKVLKSGDVIKKTVEWGKDVKNEGKDILKDSGIASKFHFNNKKADESFDKMFDNSFEDELVEMVQFEAANGDVGQQPGVSRPIEDLKLKINIDDSADLTMYQSNEEVSQLMGKIKGDFRNQVTNEVANNVNNSKDYANASKLIYEAEVRIETFEKGADRISNDYSTSNHEITRDFKFALNDHVFQNNKTFDTDFLKQESSSVLDKRKAAFIDTVDKVSNETGIDFKAYVIEELSNMS